MGDTTNFKITIDPEKGVLINGENRARDFTDNIHTLCRNMNMGQQQEVCKAIEEIFKADDKEIFKERCLILLEKLHNNGFKATFPDYAKILWTSRALSSSGYGNDKRLLEMINDDKLLTDDKIRLGIDKKWVVDTNSPAFSFLWQLIRNSMTFITANPNLYGKYLKTISNKFFQLQKNRCEHLAYDGVLSELWVETITDEEIKNIRIEIGQHNPNLLQDKPMVRTIKTDNVFFTSELPALLIRVAKYNLNKDRLERDKIKIIDMFNFDRMQSKGCEIILKQERSKEANRGPSLSFEINSNLSKEDIRNTGFGRFVTSLQDSVEELYREKRENIEINEILKKFLQIRIKYAREGYFVNI